MIHGDVDEVVPLKENSAALVESYKANDAAAQVELVVVEGQGHNFWPGYFRSQELVDFAIERARVGSQQPVESDREKEGR
jgi:pimeloyl-ACP methyl ester carboxylesterase